MWFERLTGFSERDPGGVVARIREDGIDRYDLDPTQGPACAIACGAGTVHRNYLVPFPDVAARPGGRPPIAS